MREQEEVAKQHGVVPMPVAPRSKVGLAITSLRIEWPLNGLRHPPDRGTNGWYIWAGEELSQDPDFFQPLHVEHLADYVPQVVPYLSLPPGFRFLLAPDYEDVWEDKTLLEV